MKFIKRFLSIMLVFMLVLTGCSQTSNEGKKEEAATKTITDILGRKVEIPSESDSIIALQIRYFKNGVLYAGNR